MRKLNVCCGARLLADYVNIDIVQAAARPPDILCNAMSIPLGDQCASEILCIHGFEHFYRWEAPALLAEWRRLLMPRGLLVLELPNLRKCCENVLKNYTRAGKHPDQAGMWGLYGDPRTEDPFMCHRWGWTPETLAELLAENGFCGIEESPTEWHPAGRERRDMRLTAYRRD